MNINMSNPEAVRSNGVSIMETTKTIDDIITNINDIVKSLETWQSDTKTKFESILREETPKMVKLSEVLKSYGNVAKNAGERIVTAEDEIRKTMENI